MLSLRPLLQKSFRNHLKFTTKMSELASRTPLHLSPHSSLSSIQIESYENKSKINFINRSSVLQQRSMTSQSDNAATKSTKPLTNLLKIILQACYVVTPFVREVYANIPHESHENSPSKKSAASHLVFKKADKSALTIADGMVQEFLVSVLQSAGVTEIVGEESVELNLTVKPYHLMVDGQKVLIPEVLTSRIDKTITEVKGLCHHLDQLEVNESLKDVCAWIDPIDGTKEFSNGRGSESTIMIGISKNSQPIGGVIFRPIATYDNIDMDPEATEHCSYAVGTRVENYYQCHLTPARELSSRPCLLTSSSGVSPFLVTLAKNLDYELCPIGGAGNKFLFLLEGKGHAYIQDRGVCRWDTCAGQAILEACGGVAMKLRAIEKDDHSFNFISDAKGEYNRELNYGYLKGLHNSDFESGLVTLTKKNAKDVQDKMGIVVEDVEKLDPYVNTMGLFALPLAETRKIPLYVEAIRKSAQQCRPKY